jgi:ATP-dependent Clp protease ATP-binding subunit ClpB
MPVELDEIERKLRQLEIEKQAMMREDAKESKEKLGKIASEMS